MFTCKTGQRIDFLALGSIKNKSHIFQELSFGWGWRIGKSIQSLNVNREISCLFLGEQFKCLCKYIPSYGNLSRI